MFNIVWLYLRPFHSVSSHPILDTKLFNIDCKIEYITNELAIIILELPSKICCIYNRLRDKVYNAWGCN